MRSATQIVHDGGWIPKQAYGKPRARLFAFLAVIWTFVSAAASFPFWAGWPEPLTYLEVLCIALMLPQPAFIILSIWYLLNEHARTTIEHHYRPGDRARKAD